MRDPLRALYYPASSADDITFKKCALLFDQIHFMDRPSFMFEGRFGMVGCPSPLRPYEQSFREHGLPLYVHGAPGGIVHGELLNQVKADLADKRFVTAFQQGLRNSALFRELHVTPGNYGASGTHHDVSRRLCDIDLNTSRGESWEVLTAAGDPFSHTTPEGVFRNLLHYVATNSAVLNFALTVGEREGFVPIADASPYADLISAKFARAASNGKSLQVPLADLSFAIFDELVTPETLRSLSLGDIVKYRKESEQAREAFLEMVMAFHAKAQSPRQDGDYEESIQRIIDLEVRPAARQFKNKLQSIHETLFGKIGNSAVTWFGGSGLAHLLTGMSWEQVLALATAATAAQAVAQVSESQQAKRAARRECAISYVLDIESQKPGEIVP